MRSPESSPHLFDRLPMNRAMDAVADVFRRALEGARRFVVGIAAAVVAISAAFGVVGCRDKSGQPGGSDSAPPWASGAEVVTPRPGMMWIPKGSLVVGTPLDRIPRVPDAEMAGEQIVLGGFYIDLYPYPNEVGAIPQTNVTRDEAKALCESDGKRLCTELELERACKGPGNTVYPYGNDYRPTVCATGDKRGVVPNGFNATCKSAFGVLDMAGSVWVWTASDWGRGTDGLVAQRSGNGPSGELLARCANGRGQKPDVRAVDVGVRCCAGPANPFQVTVAVTRAEALHYRRDDDEMAARVQKTTRSIPNLAEGLLGSSRDPSNPGITVTNKETFVAERSWTWHPVGNEELLLGGGCTRPGDDKSCGVLVARASEGALAPLAWVSTDHWQPTIAETETSRIVWIYGGDDYGAFRKRVSYEWGRIGIGEKERKKKRGKKYYFD